MSAAETLELIRAAQQGDTAAGEEVLCSNSGLIWSVVRRFLGRGLEQEDLYQIACIGFVKAIQGFDFTYETQFSTYAVPKIAGEIRRFLRDDGALKVGRGLREQAQMIYTARKRLLEELQREPVLSELSEVTGLSAEEIAYVQTALTPPDSLQRETEEGLTLEGILGTECTEERLVESISLRQAMEQLPQRERMTLELRFYRGFTQVKTARVLQVSQVQVSRLERRALDRLRLLLREE